MYTSLYVHLYNLHAFLTNFIYVCITEIAPDKLHCIHLAGKVQNQPFCGCISVIFTLMCCSVICDLKFRKLDQKVVKPCESSCYVYSVHSGYATLPNMSVYSLDKHFFQMKSHNLNYNYLTVYKE